MKKHVLILVVLLIALLSLVAAYFHDSLAVRIPPMGDLATCVTPSPGKRRVLISLHSWGGDYRQYDSLRSLVTEKGWGYIRPNLWGPNNHPRACLSADVVSALDACFDYAANKWGVGAENIVLVGHSGGGHAALGYWHLGRHRPAAIIVWNPITSLADWHQFVSARDEYHKYAESLRKVLGSEINNDSGHVRLRSPLYLSARKEKWSPIHIYAGIHDGWSGSVPIWHSLAYFNKFSLPADVVPKETFERLMSRETLEPSIQKLDGRSIYLERRSGHLSLTVFDGGHEVLADTYHKLIMGYDD